MKTLAKTLIVIGLAIFLGRLLVTYTSWWEQRYKTLFAPASVQDTPSEYTSGVSEWTTISTKQDELDREYSIDPDVYGVIIGDDVTTSSRVPAEQIMNYYKQHKTELWSWTNLPL